MLELVTGFKGIPHVTADQQGYLYAGIFGTGAHILNTANKCTTSTPSSTRVSISTGDIIVHGRHVRVTSTETVNIQNGAQGKKRYDLIGVRYSKNSSGVESVRFEVLTGTASTTPQEPTYSRTSILSGTADVFVPIFRVELNGLSITGVTRLAPLVQSLENQETVLRELANKVQALEIKQQEPTGGVVTYPTTTKYKNLRYGTDARDRLVFHYTKDGILYGLIITDTGLRLYNFTQDKTVWNL